MAARKGPIRVLHYGLGPIGIAVARQVAERKGFKIVGAVDIDPAKAGRDLGEIAGLGAEYVSVGALTHSAPAADISFELERA